MFWPDILAYRRFYGTRLGQMAGRQIRRHLRRQWPDAYGRVVALGYGLPYCRVFKDKATLITACMPAMQGGIQWPSTEHNRTLLTDEYEMPFPDSSIDFIVLSHILEHTHAPHQLMQEVWRVLSPGGKVMALVPNRRSVWARTDATPFGYGRPYSDSQLRSVMQDARFSCNDSGTMLFFPPSRWKLLLRSSAFLEQMGAIALPWFGGLLWLEAEKQVLAILPKDGVSVRSKRPVLIPEAKPVLGM